jgi:hypothetical protein
MAFAFVERNTKATFAISITREITFDIHLVPAIKSQRMYDNVYFAFTASVIILTAYFADQSLRVPFLAYG